MSGFDSAAAILPGSIRKSAFALSDNVRHTAQEFRLRRGRPPGVVTPGGEMTMDRCHIVDSSDLLRMLEIATGASPYAAAAGLEKGYVTAPGGVRVGICGRRARAENGEWTWAGITSAAIRIPREVKGCAGRLCKAPPVSTLIAAPPGLGKTTLLRDMVRTYSDQGYRVGLCDERGEVAAETDQRTGFDVGRHTDVLTGTDKTTAAWQLLRTMNPQIIAMDEITEGEDMPVCIAAARSGVILIATAHACDTDLSRLGPSTAKLLAEHVFRRIIGIRMEDGNWLYEEMQLS